MSEYQYYEFQAIDRPLTEKEQAAISKLSSRVDLSPTSAAFTYSYSDFPADAMKILKEYFDALLYIANWGTKRLAFRFPLTVVDPKVFKPYCIGDAIKTYTTKDHVVLDMNFDSEEGGGWVEGEGMLSQLAALREDIMKGDLRSVYLGWLAAISIDLSYYADEEYDEDEVSEWLEPPVPVNLNKLSGPLKKLIEFFEIDKNLIDAACDASEQTDKEAVMNIEALVAKLSEQERNTFLVKLAKGEANLNILLNRRLHELSSGKKKGNDKQIQNRRTASELLASAKDKTRKKKEKEKQAAEKIRINRLNELGKKEVQTWKEVFNHINQKNPKSYDEAVSLLTELKELAIYQQTPQSFQERLDGLMKQYNNLSGLKSRIISAKL